VAEYPPDRLDSRISVVAADVADKKPRLRIVARSAWMVGTSIAGIVDGSARSALPGSLTPAQARAIARTIARCWSFTPS
jgi:hypothetical protein